MEGSRSMINTEVISFLDKKIQHEAETMSYEEGLHLSRNFQRRNRYQTLLLQNFIQLAVKRAKDITKEKESKKALTFLITAYEPFILFVTKSILLEMYFPEDYLDLKQYVYESFILLVYKYTSNQSSFSYYIKKYLKIYTKEYIKKYLHYSVEMPTDNNVLEYVAPFKYTSDTDSTFNICMVNILKEVYIKFILEKADCYSRTATIKEVCFRHFLGSDSCVAIAKDLGITYTSVYQIITKIKYELAQYLSSHPYCSYVITNEKQVSIHEKCG